MNRRLLVWSMVLPACLADDASDEFGSSDSADSVNDSSVDESTDEGSDQGESGTADGGEDAGGSASTTSSDGTTETEGTDEGACPDNPNASECEACVLDTCCEQLLACDQSESCSCLFDCTEQGTELLACLVDCGLNGPDLTFTDFTSCVQRMCAEPCG